MLAGLPGPGNSGRNFLSPAARALLGVKAADAVTARDQLDRIAAKSRRGIVAALLPVQPARLWTDGPDAAAAAQVWNQLIGRRTAVPEALLGEAVRAVRSGWAPGLSLPAVVDPAASPELSRDLRRQVKGDRVAPVDEHAEGFTERTLMGTGTVAMLAWLA